jgi:hypothetical protein
MREWRHKPRLRLLLAVCGLAVAARDEARNEESIRSGWRRPIQVSRPNFTYVNQLLSRF